MWKKLKETYKWLLLESMAIALFLKYDINSAMKELQMLQNVVFSNLFSLDLLANMLKIFWNMPPFR